MKQLPVFVWLSVVTIFATSALAQELSPPGVDWKRFSYSVLAHGAGTGFDAWTSWQHVERNRFLADGARFTAASAGKKAGVFGAVTVVQVVILKKWGERHPWVEKAFRIANFGSAGAFTSAGIRNLGVAAR